MVDQLQEEVEDIHKIKKQLMANENIDISSEKSLILDEVSTRTLNKRFGRPEDYVELYIYDSLGEILFANENFEDYTFPGGINLSKAESSAPIDGSAQ